MDKSNNQIERPLGACCSEGNKGAKALMPDYEVFGNSDTFVLVSKFSSEKAGIMKSTKALDYGAGCIVQVTTQQRNPDGSFSIAEALTNVPDVELVTRKDANGELTRAIVAI